MIDKTDGEIRQRIFEKVAQLAGVDASEVGAEATLDSLGLDSADAVVLAMEVEEVAGREIDVGIFLRHPTIDQATTEIVKLLSE